MNNESILRSLQASIPGNMECADCGKTGKHVVKFCSVKLGVFLCNQCYAAHRALGAHVTRGKCIGLDGFTSDEIELLKANGNVRVNARYEANMPPTAKPPPTKCNGCSLRSCHDCQERLQFIREKYETQKWYSESNTKDANGKIPAAANSQDNGDPFGLFSTTPNNVSSNSNTQRKKPQLPPNPSSDTNFFASFGL